MQSKMEKLSNVNFTMTNGNVYEPPQGEMEEKLAAIWSELLGIECISRRDNFFALGGHSLLIVRMLTQLRQAGLDTCFGKVFGTPNLAALAKTVVHYKTPGIPSNLITKDSTMITPDMLPLIDLTQQEIDELVAQVPGGIANIQDIYGLAPSQQAILSNHITAKHGDPYLLVNCLEFIDRSALERYAAALQHVIERRDILRTVFIWKGLSEPAQVVLHRVPSLLAEVSLDDTDETVQEKLKNRFSPRHYRLDLRQAPPMQLFVAPTSEGGWTAIQLMHQIIGDHSTVQRLYSEVQTIINGENEQLATPTPFRHVVAQARLGVSQAEHNQFFSGMLADIDTPTLAFGLNDIQLDGTNIDEANLKIPQALNNQLRMHARHFRVSLASLCHLAWAQVLAHTNGNENIVFGTVLLQQFYSGKENDSAMEILTNTLPFRLDIDDTAVDDVVRNVHSRLSALLTHEHASLALAQRCSGVPAGLPLFNALLNYRHNFQTENITELSASEAQTIHPLTMSVDDNKEALYLTAQVMSPISAVRICAYMQQALISLVDALADTPHQPVRALTVMPSEEREMLLHIWNQTNVNYPSDRCLHQLFEAQVERDGRAIAVKCGDESLSYEELNVQSNRLAHFLIAQGVKPDDPVALCVKRSTKLLVAILGILKAGGAYVPLDPAYPSQRLTNILVDADPRCLLVDCIGKKALVDHEVPVLDLDEALPDNLSTCNADPAKLGLTSAHLVYIVYTSGTTGVPKGVLVEHRQVTNYLYWCKETFATEDFQHTLFSTSVGFDPSVFQSFAPLSMGKTTHIVANPLAITKIPLNFSLLDTVPSVVNVILNASTLPFSLRTLSVVGEPLNARLINRIFTHTKITKLYNLYGSTESTYATFHLYKPGDHVFETIGRPISNSRIYLLDAHGQLVPFGAEGELYIGGAVIARGYLNRPELTAERFLPDPFSENPSAQMFRTGDRARYLPDGNLVYLGRIDHQMNIRGFRVEPGEIEALLVEHPLVRDAIVQAWTDGPEANVRLIAYVVADSNISLAQNLRTYLTNILPDYMVPAAYVCLSSLPITANGKLDRSALPPPSDEAFARQSYEAPQGEIEEKLELIWSELLSIERISRNDNFFELGGHSLLIVRMLTQLRQLGLEATVQEVFGNPSLAALAKIIGKYQKIIIPPNMISKNCKKITPDMMEIWYIWDALINR
ncbi:uncharacterized protein LOC116347467 [Contarinia nasturtii]|uniref:uncharacterized protein LOC116347467 n=1 Tax=Contarinia nasturtii TaxID=265458 RepID=UPI0012D449CA|nr:uncharacterized protein LOC116347467 [Contarinia nasturtii]